MPITRAAQAPRFDLDGVHFVGFTAPSRGATELCTWQLELDPGAGGHPHRLSREEVFVALDGTLSFTIDDEAIELSRGDALAVPANCLMEVANHGQQTARALVCVSAGFTAVYADGREIGTPPWAQ